MVYRSASVGTHSTPAQRSARPAAAHPPVPFALADRRAVHLEIRHERPRPPSDTRALVRYNMNVPDRPFTYIISNFSPRSLAFRAYIFRRFDPSFSASSPPGWEKSLGWKRVMCSCAPPTKFAPHRPWRNPHTHGEILAPRAKSPHRRRKSPIFF